MKKKFSRHKFKAEPVNTWIETVRPGIGNCKRKCVQQYLDTKNSLGARGVPM